MYPPLQGNAFTAPNRKIRQMILRSAILEVFIRFLMSFEGVLKFESLFQKVFQWFKQQGVNTDDN